MCKHPAPYETIGSTTPLITAAGTAARSQRATPKCSIFLQPFGTRGPLSPLLLRRFAASNAREPYLSGHSGRRSLCSASFLDTKQFSVHRGCLTGLAT